MDVDPHASIGELSAKVRSGSLSPVDLVEACLGRIDKLNGRLNAFATVARDQARSTARALEAEAASGRWRGPLHGIPVGVKDFYDTAGIRTTAAFEAFARRVPSRDAAGVARLKNAGAIIIGKTNMHTLGMGTTGLESLFGPVRNPSNEDYIAGGSSSGSAAAVASGMCFATFDTDAIGSCRLPAACCGVVGFKGTYGLIDPGGILEGEAPPDETIRWFNHPAVMARRAADVAILLDALAERNARIETIDSWSDVTGSARVRVGVATNFDADADVRAAFEKAVKKIDALGHVLVDTVVPFAGPDRGISKIERDREAIAGELFVEIDVLMLPTTTAAVPRVTAAAGHPLALSAANTAFANYYGIPAVSVPCGLDSNRLPVGLQIVGRPWGDLLVLGLAREYETVRD